MVNGQGLKEGGALGIMWHHSSLCLFTFHTKVQQQQNTGVLKYMPHLPCKSVLQMHKAIDILHSCHTSSGYHFFSSGKVLFLAFTQSQEFSLPIYAQQSVLGTVTLHCFLQFTITDGEIKMRNLFPA